MTWELTADHVQPVRLDDWSAGFVVESWEVGSPQVRAVVDTPPGRDGTDDQTTRVGARAVTLAVAAVADPSPLRYLVDRLAPYADPSRRLTLVHTDPQSGVRRTLKVRSDGDLSQPWNNFSHLRLMLGFVTVGAPFWLGAERVVGLAISPDGSAPGVAFPISFPMSFPAALPGLESGWVRNDGTKAASWRATIEGPATAIRLENLTTQRALQLFPVGLGPGERMVLDSYERSVTVEGDRRFNVAVLSESSDWWDIPPGDSQLRMVAAGAGDPAQVSITWHDTYYL